MFGKKDTLMAKELKELREELGAIRAEMGKRLMSYKIKTTWKPC